MFEEERYEPERQRQMEFDMDADVSKHDMQGSVDEQNLHPRLQAEQDVAELL
jgi:hypothetical protein